MKQLLLTLGLFLAAVSTALGQEFRFVVTSATTVKLSYRQYVDKQGILHRMKNSYDGDIVIPSTYDGKVVTGIDELTFDECTSLTSVTIPETVTLIQGYAFQKCSLPELTIPASVDSIGTGAFDGMYTLKKLTIADGDKVIKFANSQDYGAHGMFSYDHQSKLEEVYVGRNWTVKGNGLFASNASLKKLTTGNFVSSIPANSFYGCANLQTATFNQGLTRVGEKAFMYCSTLSDITLPESVTTIENSAFFSCVKAKTVTLPQTLKQIDASAFGSVNAVTELTIPANVDTIGTGAFCEMEGLKKLVIEDSDTPPTFR